MAIVNPNEIGVKGHLFGLPCLPEQATVVIIPVPWEATVSYHTGTSQGPQAMIEASCQVDVWHPKYPNAWQMGMAVAPLEVDWHAVSDELRQDVAPYLETLANDQLACNIPSQVTQRVDGHAHTLKKAIQQQALKYFQQGKLVGLIGGEHSTPLGLMMAMQAQYQCFGILQIDAHADLRKNYEGFTSSHASIMWQALKLSHMTQLVQVGIRDVCDQEMEVVQQSQGRIVTFLDQWCKTQQMAGTPWASLVKTMIAPLPQHVYLSVDIDGLDPSLCPTTGTPVPGGLSFAELVYLIEQVVASGKKIIGFDLCEVAPGANSDWDAQVGSRVLYQLIVQMAASQGKIK